jgi:hypothetical protein
VNWGDNALCYYHDVIRGDIIIGRYGFAWKKLTHWQCAKFSQPQTYLLYAYLSFTKWSEVRPLDPHTTPKASVLALLRTGIWPQ